MPAPVLKPSRLKTIGLWGVLYFLVIALGFFSLDFFRGGSPVAVAQAPREAQQAPVPIKKPAFHFVAMGDWGAGSPMQYRVAEQMIALHKKTPYNTVLLLGDNIYPDGNIKKHAEAYFNKPYKPLIDANVHFVTALGNHDVLTFYGDDQVEFFNMPARYYKVEKPMADIFVLDTNTFGGNEVQQQWLEKSLRESQACWKIVMGHHPIYTSGEHGPSKSLKKTLEPLLVKYKVPLYLAGHDHDYERFELIQGVQHIVSGGGGAWPRKFETPQPGSLIRKEGNHFLFFEVQEDAISMEAIDQYGKVIDKARWMKQPQAKQLPSAS